MAKRHSMISCLSLNKVSSFLIIHKGRHTLLLGVCIQFFDELNMNILTVKSALNGTNQHTSRDKPVAQGESSSTLMLVSLEYFHLSAGLDAK